MNVKAMAARFGALLSVSTILLAEKPLEPVLPEAMTGPSFQQESGSVPRPARRFMVPATGPVRGTSISISEGRWLINREPTYPGSRAEGLLMNVRMVNSVFEDQGRPDFDPDANSAEFLANVSGYVAQGLRAFTISLQGGFPGYEGAVNSAFNSDGSLREDYMRRVRKLIEACSSQGAIVILSCYYQRQDQILEDSEAIKAGLVNVGNWVKSTGMTNVLIEIANEFNHPGFDHPILKTVAGQVELVDFMKGRFPCLLVSTSGYGDGLMPAEISEAADFILIHFNSVPVSEIAGKIEAQKRFGKPIVCNEDDKVAEEGAAAAEASVTHGASWGFMHSRVNQHYPFVFNGPQDDEVVYRKIRELTHPAPSSGTTR